MLARRKRKNPDGATGIVLAVAGIGVMGIAAYLLYRNGKAKSQTESSSAGNTSVVGGGDYIPYPPPGGPTDVGTPQPSLPSGYTIDPNTGKVSTVSLPSGHTVDLNTGKVTDAQQQPVSDSYESRQLVVQAISQVDPKFAAARAADADYVKTNIANAAAAQAAALLRAQQLSKKQDFESIVAWFDTMYQKLPARTLEFVAHFNTLPGMPDPTYAYNTANFLSSFATWPAEDRRLFITPHFDQAVAWAEDLVKASLPIPSELNAYIEWCFRKFGVPWEGSGGTNPPAWYTGPKAPGYWSNMSPAAQRNWILKNYHYTKE